MSEKVPEGWKRVKLGDVAEFSQGIQVPLENQTKKKKLNYVRFIRIIDFTKKDEKEIRYIPFPSKKYIVKEDDVIMIRYGSKTAGMVVRGISGAIANNMFKITVCEKVDKNFLYYYLIQKKIFLYFRNSQSSSTMPAVTFDMLEKLAIEMPTSIEEQKAIASILSSLDNKIDLLHRQNQTLEKMAETLFRQWFIEEAKEDWEEKPLKEIYIFEKGFEPGSKNYLEDKIADSIRFIRVGDMLSEPSVYIKKEMAQKTCTKKDLIISFDGTVGRITFGVEGAYSSGIRKIYSKNPIYDNLGLKYLIFSSKDIQDLIRSHTTGTVILHASSSIDYLTFSFPPENEVREFNKIITPIFDKILSNKKQIRTLEKLRDTLLPKLMSGGVRMRK